MAAAEAAPEEATATLSAAEVLFWVNNTWMLLATFLVFIMHLGLPLLSLA